MRFAIGMFAAAVFAGFGCAKNGGPREPAAGGAGAPPALTVTSRAFEPGAAIPAKHTGEGEDVSPHLAWTGAPAATKSFAVICDDPDAPRDEPWVHWVLYGLAPSVTELPEGGNGGGTEGRNDFGEIGWNGPMPPKGHGVHHYHVTIFALDAAPGLEAGASKTDLLAAIEGRVLAQGEIVGTYERK